MRSRERGAAPDVDPGWVGIGIAVASCALVAVAVSLLVVHLRHVQWNMIDLSVYRWGGLTVRSHGALYDGQWSGADIANYHDSPLPFTYTPAAALAFVPLSFLPLSWLQVLIVVVDVAAVGGCLLLSFRMLGHHVTRPLLGLVVTMTAVAMLLEPVTQTVSFGQINLVLLAMILADLALPDDHPLKGLLIGIAIGIKLTPAIFAVYFLITGRWKPAVRAVVAFAGTVVIAGVLIPGETRQFWVGRLFMDASRVGTVDYAGNQSLNGALVRLLGDSAGTHLVWLGAALAVGAGGLIAARWLHRSGRELEGATVCALTGLLVSPISWDHHWVWVIPAAAIAVDAALRGRRWALGALVAGVAVFASLPVIEGVVWAPPHGGHAEQQWSLVQSLPGDAYVLAGLAALAAVGAAIVAAHGRAGAPAVIDLDALDATPPIPGPVVATGPAVGAGAPTDAQ
jgi:alpha-1,2-mannosyltransferase